MRCCAISTGGGLTLSTCSDHKHLSRKVSTLKVYCRRLKLAFPDYVPLALRPKKEPKVKKRARKAQAVQVTTK